MRDARQVQECGAYLVVTAFAASVANVVLLKIEYYVILQILVDLLK